MSESDSPFRDVQLVNHLIGVSESFQAPTAMMKIIMDKEQRESLFSRFQELESDMSYDWFRVYFEEDQANRSKLKQDFTPQSITDLLSRFGSGHEYYEPAAGTGGMMISRWWRDRISTNFFAYRPSMFFYHLEELGNAALPFLLFNCLIRGLNATIVHGDSLERTAQQVYFVQNDSDSIWQYSSLNIMPHTQDCINEFSIKRWLEPEKKHIESLNLTGPVAEVIYQMRGGRKGGRYIQKT